MRDTGRIWAATGFRVFNGDPDGWLERAMLEHLAPLAQCQSSREVAAFFLAKEIKGKPGCQSRCILANYLHAKFGGEVRVTASIALVDLGETYATVGLPPAVSQFVLDFDDNRYPPLEETA